MTRSLVAPAPTEPWLTVVLPVLNNAAHVGEAIESVAAATSEVAGIEVLVIDNGSSDASLDVAQTAVAAIPGSRVLQQRELTGPGVARNTGIEDARGEWLVFLDSDDALIPRGIDRIRSVICGSPGADIVFFNWVDHADSMQDRRSTMRFGRRDLHLLERLPKQELLRAFMRFQIDPSVIYAAFRRSLVREHAIRFASGYHEDFDFMFRAICASSEIAVCREATYSKRARRGSIVNSVSRKHMEGFARAWRVSVDLGAVRAIPAVDRAELLRDSEIALLATRVREIFRHTTDVADREALLGSFYDIFGPEIADLRRRLVDEPRRIQESVYWTIARTVVEAAADDGSISPDRLGVVMTDVGNTLESVQGKSWSCVDLQRSVFLRSDQVRACCKRFFVDGEMRGDVVLIDADEVQGESPTAADILAAKHELLRKINSGENSACSGCPFLEFKKWEPLERLEVRYLSMEYHSVCNFRCTYCSDEYYGGKKATYSVPDLIADLRAVGALATCELVVWGGGEPTVDRDFPGLVREFGQLESRPIQRFLTNATKCVPEVVAGIARGDSQVVTSIDAGDRETFSMVRGRDRLDDVIRNLEGYAAVDPELVTVKYIFTEGNADAAQVTGFLAIIRESNLRDCIFQISADFKTPEVPVESVVQAIRMFSGLRDLGVDFICLDELFRHRLAEDVLQVIEADALSHGWVPRIAAHSDVDSVAIWGAGQYTSYLMETAALQAAGDLKIVDSSASKIGADYFGHVVQEPSVLCGDDRRVVLSAVQGLPLMLREYDELGLDRERIVRDLIL